jgi:serine/threonine protein kinase
LEHTAVSSPVDVEAESTHTADDQTVDKEVRVIIPLTPSLLQDASAVDIQPWDGQRFRRLRQLQEAKRNHGCVELMREGGTFVAVKKMPARWTRGSPGEFDARYPNASEKPWMDVGLVRCLNEIAFPYCVRLVGVFADSESTYVVTSLASEGDLFGWCECDPKPGPKREAAMYPLVEQIFAGVRRLHDFGVAHRDLSLENLLLHIEDGEPRIKIIDFGMSTLERSASGEVRGKPSYQAPEIHLLQPFDTFMTDSFSLGVVLFAMGAQDYPWSSTKPKTCELFEYVCTFGLPRFLGKRRLRRGGGETLAEVFSPSFTALLVGLLAKDAGKRFTIGEKCFETTEIGNGARRTSVLDCTWTSGARTVEQSPPCPLDVERDL